MTINSIFYKCFISHIFQVAFSALRFAKPVQEHGNKIVEYLALHLRMEKDVWVIGKDWLFTWSEF
jgi:hypothetical protein